MRILVSPSSVCLGAGKFIVGVEARTATIRAALERVQERGELDSGRDLDTLALVVQVMTSYRLVVTVGQIDRQFVTSLIKQVLAPPSGR
jgi:hypothetical protein